MEFAGTEESQEAGRLEDFTEEREERMGWRSGSEETVDTVVAVAAASVREPDKRLLSRNSDYGSYCASPADLAATLPAQDSGEPHSPLLNTSEDSDSEASGKPATRSTLSRSTFRHQAGRSRAAETRTS